MAKMLLENRKMKLFAHIRARILAEGNSLEWIEELDAITDIVNNNEGGMKEWSFAKDGSLQFK